ncbi:ankyrin repeat domain-containing protein [Rhizobium deserti]|uniref:Ankyrin repeat domain-containing protein n=1 Tax=Rhizobium deserti TaxID=2547961 RepID=A0A4V3APY1_9HYPH|nr:ankyrin repeat domain-containing protein [Rhizobium deserti]TDK39550.1 ankyrin repeat domain-containing protein [Rhizobium deserti]
MSSNDVETFHRAVETGDVPMVMAMLQAEPKLATSSGAFGFQPMNLQDLYFEPAIFRMLIANGADVNAANDEGITLLHIIADPAPVAEVVAAGGNLEARDKDGRTPLLVNMTEPDREDVIEALIEAGANVNARSHDGKTALAMAWEAQNSVLADLLIKAGGMSERHASRPNA